MSSIKKETMAIVYSAGLALVPYLIAAVIVNIFTAGPAYDHIIPLSVGGLSFLIIWFIVHLDMR